MNDYDLKALFTAACLAGIMQDLHNDDEIRYKPGIALTVADYAAEQFLARQGDLFSETSH